MEVYEVAVSLTVAAIEDLLTRFEGLVVDERFVPSGVELTFERNEPRVVRISQDLRQDAR